MDNKPVKTKNAKKTGGPAARGGTADERAATAPGFGPEAAPGS
jgi:hypothetical protein